MLTCLSVYKNLAVNDVEFHNIIINMFLNKFSDFVRLLYKSS